MTRLSGARAWRPSLGWLGLLLVLPVIAGCSPGEGTVSGQVLMSNGKPLPGGWLTFRPADGRANAVPALIDPNGNYEAKLPEGDVQISVDNRELQRTPPGPRPEPPPGIKLPNMVDAAPAAGGKLAGTYVPIPEKYYTVETSGLRYTVTKGAQSHNIELK
jgi:hypothetical protein